MNVVHVTWGLTYGGIETMLVNIANEQCRLGAEVSVIVVNDMIDDSILNSFDRRVAVHLMHRKASSHNILFIWKFNKLLRSLNPSAIHLHKSNLYALILSKSLSNITSVTLHDLPFGKMRRGGLLAPFSSRIKFLNFNGTRGITACIDKVPRVFAISQSVHNDLKEKYGVDSRVICNGIRTNAFAKKMESELNHPLRIVQVSRLEHEKKGQDLLIRAVAKLQGRATVDFIGVGSSESYLKNLAQTIQADKWVRFLGKQPQKYIAEHLKDYDLFAQPSRFEGFGLTVAEAMASRVPVLVSEGQGPAEVTCENIYGWVFENGNLDDLIACLEEIIVNYDKATNKAQAALQHVIQNYDVSVTAQKYLEAYNGPITRK